MPCEEGDIPDVFEKMRPYLQTTAIERYEERLAEEEAKKERIARIELHLIGQLSSLFRKKEQLASELHEEKCRVNRRVTVIARKKGCRSAARKK